MLRARCWCALALVYLVLSADAIAHTAVISSMNQVREGMDRTVFELPDSSEPELDLEKLLSRMSISRSDFVSWGMGSAAEFDGFMGHDEDGKPIREMSFSQFQAYSNRVGKTPSTISIQEYPFLVRRICSTPTFYNICIEVGPYTFVQGLAVLIFFLMGSFLSFSSVLSTWVAEPASPDVSDWSSRFGGRVHLEDLEADGLRKTLAVSNTFVGLLLVLEVANLVASKANAHLSQHLADQGATVRAVRSAKEANPSDFAQIEPERKLRESQDKELGAELEIPDVATSYVDEHERRHSAFDPASGFAVNQLRKGVIVPTLVTALLWGIIMIMLIGVISRGMMSKYTWVNGAFGPFASSLPLMTIALFLGMGYLCRGNEPTCVVFRKRTRSLTLGLLSLFGTVLLITRSFEKMQASVKFDPLAGLGLPTKFDFNPTSTPATVGRTFGLFGGWLLLLALGIMLIGNSAGTNVLSKIVSKFASDGSQLFTHSLVIVLHLYLFWHDSLRYSSTKAIPTNIINKDLPGWADAYIYGLFEFIMDLASIYPIIYDYLTYKHNSHITALKNIDILMVVLVAMMIMARTKQVNNQAADTQADGKKFNQMMFVISGMVAMALMVLVTARDGKVSATTGLFGILFFVICLGLYLMVELGTYGGASGDSPIADGHVISDLNMLSAMTMLVTVLQRIVHQAEPNWVYPAGSTMASHLPLVLAFLGSTLGFGWARLQGRADAEFTSLDQIKQHLRSELATLKVQTESQLRSQEESDGTLSH